MKNALERAASLRTSFLEGPRKNAFRLYDGFREGDDRLVVDVLGSTLVIVDHRKEEIEDEAPIQACVEAARALVPGLTAAIWKSRRRGDKGRMVLGTEEELCRKIEENGVRYAVRLLAHRDPGFFVDTRSLRRFLKEECGGKRVLNTFAYTGSLGVAARSAPASQVVHTDKNKELLNVTKDSYALNGFEVRRPDFVASDYFDLTAQLRRKNELFDVVVVDPPFFADAATGRVDLEHDLGRLLAKARPLVAHEGRLVVVVNALFVSGAALLEALGELCKDGYAKVERHIDVDADCAPPLREGASLPSDPAPFNHPTKIVALRLTRRDGALAQASLLA